MEQEKRLARNILMMLMLVFLAASCSKTADMPGRGYADSYLKSDRGDSTGDTSHVDTSYDSTRVDTTYFIGPTNGKGVKVYINGCPWGSAFGPGGYSHALNVFGLNGEMVAEGSCNSDASHLKLKRGLTPGTVGPSYYFRPATTVTPVKYLRLKVRNISSASGTDYNQMFTFHASTNTWTWLPTAGTYFDIGVVTALPMCVK